MANISKLTSDQISEMRRLYEEGATQKSLAERYGVSVTTVIVKLKSATAKQQQAAAIALESATVRSLTEEERKQDWIPEDKKKEKPKRRIVGVNI